MITGKDKLSLKGYQLEPATVTAALLVDYIYTHTLKMPFHYSMMISNVFYNFFWFSSPNRMTTMFLIGINFYDRKLSFLIERIADDCFRYF